MVLKTEIFLKPRVHHSCVSVWFSIALSIFISLSLSLSPRHTLSCSLSLSLALSYPWSPSCSLLRHLCFYLPMSINCSLLSSLLRDTYRQKGAKPVIILAFAFLPLTGVLGHYSMLSPTSHSSLTYLFSLPVCFTFCLSLCLFSVLLSIVSRRKRWSQWPQ